MLIQANAIHIPLKDESVDCVVTDPPYELGFMGKKWDSTGVTFQVETWKEVLRVMKPGAMLFCFGGTRTHHRLMCAIEDAGFEIRDCLMWLYGSGFPKSHDISKAIDRKKDVLGIQSQGANYAGGDYLPRNKKYRSDYGYVYASITPEAKQWAGFGTALKPAYEPIILAMKPLDGTFAQNALKWGVAGLNIDAGRIGIETRTYKGSGAQPHKLNAHAKGDTGLGYMDGSGKDLEFTAMGRWPANVILDEEAAMMLDKQTKETRASKPRGGKIVRHTFKDAIFNMQGEQLLDGNHLNDSGGASRFFYCAKASRSERNAGLEKQAKQFSATMGAGIGKREHDPNEPRAYVQNYHPTIKPLVLIEYLVKLGSRPSHIVLDPFVGSGTTCIACEKLNRIGIGLDLSWEYLSEIAAKRLSQPIQRELVVL